MSRRKKFTNPIDFKTGTVLFTPVLKATGKRLEMRVDFRTFPAFDPTDVLGYRGTVQDLKTGTRYAVYGKECDIPGCNCDAWAVEISGDGTELPPDSAV